jgi:ribosomal RNA assembly protein
MKIPEARIPILIGHKGETKKEIENLTGSKINIDSKTGDVEIIQNIDSKDENYNPLNIFLAEKIVLAIGRGFNPKKALKLLEEGISLEIIKLDDIIGKSEKRLKRVKGRIIGRNGEVRGSIEKYSSVYMSVYGRTVSLIGGFEEIKTSRKALSMIINGAPLNVVLAFLEKKHREMKKEEFRKIYKPDFF